MSIYFYTTKKDKIKALCGVKAIIVPIEIARKIKEILDNIEQKNLSEKTLKKEFIRCLEKECSSDELKEEYDHFKCLAHSKAAKFFYIRNFLLRLAYASYTRKRITRPTLNPHSIFRDVLKYFIDYTFFHYAACPFIEAHSFFLAPKEQEEKGEDPLYQERIKIARKFLDDYLRDLKKTDSSFRRVGKRVDRNFCLLLRLERETFEKLEYEPNIGKKYLRHGNSYFLLHRMFGGLIRYPRLWINLGRAIFSKFKLVFPNIKSRLFPRNSDDCYSILLPAFLTEKNTIDPMMAFPYGQQSRHSHKNYYPAPLNGGLANLFWHILSRCAVIASFINLGLDEVEIYTYFKKLRRFNEHWRHQIKDVQFDMDLLDNYIIYQVTKQFEKHPKYPPWKRIAYLEKIALNIFKKYREEGCFDSRESSPYNSAVNCSYMHI